jgi:hypothetical protein
MCYLITATLPPGADAGAVRALAKRFGRGWALFSTRHIARQLRPCETYYLATRGWCDCETGLGAVKRYRSKDDAGAKAKHVNKPGWSAAKIARATADRQAALARRSERWEESGAKDAGRWLDFLHATAGSGIVPSLGLLLHFYDGPVEDAEFGFERERCSLAKTNALALMTMEEDRLYEFLP